jgi:4-hydroxybenzoate polyprenyltransferase
MLKKLFHYFTFIKFEHSIFALPFALSGALLAEENGLPEFSTLVWIILAAVGARSFAMSLNRIIDKDIDAKNPRTKVREIPEGKISIKEATVFSITSLIVFIYATLQLPRLCLYLLPIAAVWFLIYPYTKRFTFLAHIWLGVAIGASVLAGWIAVAGEINSTVPFTLGSAVLCWVAGFDIIYACQDYEHDKKNNLQSIPAKFGIKSALIISRVFHGITIFLLFITGLTINSSIIYWVSVIFVMGMLYYEQSLVKHNDLSKVNLAFFTINGWISVGFLVFILLEKMI